MPTDPNITVTITVQLKGFLMPAAKQIQWTQVASAWHGSVDGVKLFSVEYAVIRDDKGRSWVLYNRIPGYKAKMYVPDEDRGKGIAEGILEGFVKRVKAD